MSKFVRWDGSETERLREYKGLRVGMRVKRRSMASNNIFRGSSTGTFTDIWWEKNRDGKADVRVKIKRDNVGRADYWWYGFWEPERKS